MSDYEIEKRCAHCHRMLRRDRFGKDKNRADGLCCYCRECARDKRRKWFSEHREWDRERNRKWRRANKTRLAARDDEYRRANLHKARAQRRVARAVKSGRLIRPDTCQRCGLAGTPQAHHPDYAEPLTVEWLCRSCHQREHAG